MSKKLITLDIDDDLAKAKILFDETHIHHILVIEKKCLVGVISDRDIFKQLSPTVGTRRETSKDIAMANKKVNLFMNKTLVTGTESMTLNEAVIMFHQKKVSCIPIVNELNHPIGILTWRDIMRLLAQHQLQKQRDA